MEIPSAECQVPNDDIISWSDWGLRLIAFVGIATAVCLGWAWIDEFYRGVQVDTLLTVFAKDPPWMPIHTTAVPIIGDHYFGDFQLPYAWGVNVRESVSPYLASSIPSDYTPFAVLFFTAFAFMPIVAAATLYLILSVIAVVVPLWLLMSPMDIARRCMILAPLVLVTTPLAGILDRGNDSGFTIGAIICAALAWQSERWVWCGVFLAAAIAFKGYPIVLLVVPLGLRRYRFAISTTVGAIVANLISLLAIPGGFFRNFHVLLKALTSQKLTTGSQFDSWGLYSLIPKTIGLVLGPTHASGLLNPHEAGLWVFPAAYLFLIYFVVRLQRVPQWCWGSLSLASLQLVVPLSAAYTTGWACLAALWYCLGSILPTSTENSVHLRPDRDDVAMRVIVGLAIATTLVPSIVTFPGAGGLTISVTEFLSPLLLLIAICLAFVRSIVAFDAQEEGRVYAGPSGPSTQIRRLWNFLSNSRIDLLVAIKRRIARSSTT